MALSNFRFNFDFSKIEGLLYFIVREGKRNEIDYIQILFPRRIYNESTNIAILECENTQTCSIKSNLTHNTDFMPTYPNRTTLILSHFSRKINKDEQIKILINLKRINLKEPFKEKIYLNSA